MRQTIGRCVLCVALGACVAMAAMAQPGGGRGQGGRGQGGQQGAGGPGGQGAGMRMGMGGGPGMGGGGGGLERLMGDEEVRSQIGLSEEQVAKFEALRGEMRNAPRPDFTPLGPDASDEDRQQQMQRMRGEMEKRMADMRAKGEAILTPEQLKKSQVLTFQATGGLNGPMRVELLAPLNLTAEQKAEIKKITDAADQERMEMFRGMRGPGAGGGTPEEMRQRMEEGRQRMEESGRRIAEKVTAVLTPEQKATAERLTTEGAALRERLQQRGGAQGNRGGRQQQGGEGGAGEYRPNANSWQPGQGTPAEGTQPRRSFPRGNNAPQN